MPEWLAWGFGVFGAIMGGLGFTSYLQSLRRTKFPTSEEKQETRKKGIEFTNAWINAEMAHLNLSEQLKAMVEEETEKFKDILLQRELEHREQINFYLQKIQEKDQLILNFQKNLSDAEKQIADLRKQVEELTKKLASPQQNNNTESQFIETS